MNGTQILKLAGVPVIVLPPANPNKVLHNFCYELVLLDKLIGNRT